MYVRTYIHPYNQFSMDKKDKMEEEERSTTQRWWETHHLPKGEMTHQPPVPWRVFACAQPAKNYYHSNSHFIPRLCPHPSMPATAGMAGACIAVRALSQCLPARSCGILHHLEHLTTWHPNLERQRTRNKFRSEGPKSRNDRTHRCPFVTPSTPPSTCTRTTLASLRQRENQDSGHTAVPPRTSHNI